MKNNLPANSSCIMTDIAYLFSGKISY